jgi:hypothetical protein
VGIEVLIATETIENLRRKIWSFHGAVPFIGRYTSEMKLLREPISVPFSLAEKDFYFTTDFAAVVN